MPEFSGDQIIKTLATNEVLQDQNIFILSANLGSEFLIKDMLRKNGISGCLEKPIDPEELLTIISNKRNFMLHVSFRKSLNMRHSLVATLLLTLSFSSLADDLPAHWSTDNHTPHFADINGDGIDDLLLQANSPEQTSSLIFGEKRTDGVRYAVSNQQHLPTQLANNDWDAGTAQLAIADFNGDNRADLLVVLPTQNRTVTQNRKTGQSLS